jgi:hypothetical protein
MLPALFRLFGCAVAELLTLPEHLLYRHRLELSLHPSKFSRAFVSFPSILHPFCQDIC